MKRFLLPIFIFFTIFFLYFGIATDFTFKPKWALDYINPLAQSFLQFRADLPNPQSTYDLAYFNGKWYAPWGFLPALFLMPIQLVMGRFVPILYITLFFASFDSVLVYLLLSRLKREFFPRLSYMAIASLLMLYAFGTTHVYIGTLGSVWHVVQMVSNFFGTAGIYFIFKKNRTLKDYFLSSCFISISLLGRTTIVFLICIPIILYLKEYYPIKKKDVNEIFSLFGKMICIFGVPLIITSSAFFFYNFIRFNNPLEYGYSFINEAPYLADLRRTYGAFSIRNIPRNLWYMIAETPPITLINKPTITFNLKGNSIFFLTPVFLTIFLASWIQKKRHAISWDPYIISLWIAILATTIPSLMHYSSGWMQFGYRYALDITLPLLILSLFGIKGKLNILYIAGIFFSIVMYQIGIHMLK